VIDVSVIIPVYNEEQILVTQYEKMRKGLEQYTDQIEFVFAENGSTDRTPEIIRNLRAKNSDSAVSIKQVSLPEPDMGQASKSGIEAASNSYLISTDLDFWDDDFARDGLNYVSDRQNRLYMGVKPTNQADRSLLRRTITGLKKSSLNWLAGEYFQDITSYLIARTEEIKPFAEQCQLTRGVFALELVIRLSQEHWDIEEHVIRPPDLRESRKSNWNRIKQGAIDMPKLFYVLLAET
jgi:glycosyltransferase involved in cell wall biosynthesis